MVILGPVKTLGIQIIVLMVVVPVRSWDVPPPFWGKTGHRVVGEVAQQYLNGKAERAVTALLGGETLAEVSNYGDAIKSDPRYREFTPWHYVNFAPDTDYGDYPPNPDGDLIQGIQRCIAVLEDPRATGEDQVFYLKMLIHFIGDLHQPMHLGREEDKGGNDLQLQWFRRGSNLHSIWDTDMIESHGMSYTELARSLPRWSRKKIKEVQEGSLLDWVREVRQLTNRVYTSVEVGEKLSYAYSYKWWDTVEEQLLTGGLRLAVVLNDIYQ